MFAAYADTLWPISRWGPHHGKWWGLVRNRTAAPRAGTLKWPGRRCAARLADAESLRGLVGTAVHEAVPW